MNDKPPIVIDYAARPPAHPEVHGALVRGGVGLALATISFWLSWMLHHTYRPAYTRVQFLSSPDDAPTLLCAAAANVLALVLGGVGWARARRFQPNWGYRLCAIANTLNWLGLAALAAYLFHA